MEKTFLVGKNAGNLYRTYVSINIDGESRVLELTQELY